MNDQDGPVSLIEAERDGWEQILRCPACGVYFDPDDGHVCTGEAA